MVLQKPRNVLKFTAKKRYGRTYCIDVERTTETNERKSFETKIKFEVMNQRSQNIGPNTALKIDIQKRWLTTL